MLYYGNRMHALIDTDAMQQSIDLKARRDKDRNIDLDPERKPRGRYVGGIWYGDR